VEIWRRGDVGGPLNNSPRTVVETPKLPPLLAYTMLGTSELSRSRPKIQRIGGAVAPKLKLISFYYHRSSNKQTTENVFRGNGRIWLITYNRIE